MPGKCNQFASWNSGINYYSNVNLRILNFTHRCPIQMLLIFSDGLGICAMVGGTESYGLTLPIRRKYLYLNFCIK